MQPETDAPMDLRSGGKTFRDRVIRPLMFRAYMLGKMPVLGVTGSYLVEIDTRRAELILPFGWTTKNLFGRMFDSAVTAAAETTSLSLLVLHIRNQQADLTAELTRVETEIAESPDEDLHVRCADGHRYADFVARAAEQPPLEQDFQVVAETGNGRGTHQFRFRWKLKPPAAER